MDAGPKIVRGVTAASRTVTLIRRVAGPIWLRVGVTTILEVQSQHGTTPVRAQLAPVPVEGTLYLVSMYGESNWVGHLRAAGRGGLGRKGHTKAFTAIEIDGDEQERVIAKYRARLLGPLKTDFDRLPRAVDHPAFRVEPSA
jgi:hypothetical protein